MNSCSAQASRWRSDGERSPCCGRWLNALARVGPTPVPTPHQAAERRQITAMSCELIVMSDQISNGLEDLREAITVYQGSVAEIANRYDGCVISHLGNAALVLFGYPTAHEHDAEQAVRAALELCAAVGALRPGAGLPMGYRPVSRRAWRSSVNSTRPARCRIARSLATRQIWQSSCGYRRNAAA